LVWINLVQNRDKCLVSFEQGTNVVIQKEEEGGGRRRRRRRRTRR